MAVTCRKLSAPACCPAAARATTASWSTARNAVLAPGLLDGGAQGAEDVVHRAAAPARRAAGDELLEPVVAYVDLTASDADHPVPGAVGEEQAEQVPADEPVAPASKAVRIGQPTERRVGVHRPSLPWPS